MRLSAQDGVGVRLASIGLWALILSGPLLGGAGLILATVRPDGVKLTPALPVEVAAVAELAVLAHRSGVAPAVARLTSTRFADQAERADGPGPDRDDILLRPPSGTAVVGHRAAGPGRFGVMVLVLDRDGRREAWQVTVAQTTTGPIVEGLPARIPDVTPGAAPAVGIPDLRTPEPDDPLGQAVEGFLRALLIGDLDLQRYVSAPSDLTPLQPSPLVDLTLTGLAVQAIGTRVAVLADVRATRGDGGAVRLQYPLLVEREGQRWQVVRILPALPLARATG